MHRAHRQADRTGRSGRPGGTSDVVLCRGGGGTSVPVPGGRGRGGRPRHGRLPGDDRGDARPPPARRRDLPAEGGAALVGRARHRREARPDHGDAGLRRRLAAHGGHEVDPERAAEPGRAASRAGSASSCSPTPTRGCPVAVMDGTVVSAMRTGAVSGLAARALARPGTRDADAVSAPACRRARSCSRSSGRSPTSPRSASTTRREARSARFVARAAAGPPADRGLRRPARGGARRATSSSPRRWRPTPFIGQRLVRAGPALPLGLLARPRASTRSRPPTWSSPTTSTHETFHASRPLARAADAGVLDRRRGRHARRDPRRRPPGPHEPGRADPRLARRHGDRGRRLGDARVPPRAASSDSARRQRLWNAPIWT